MNERPKILLLDDDPQVLEVYQELLTQLPSRPEVRTADSGARAITMLEAEPYSLLLCDLNMPHMHGLQVLAIVRRKFPQLRTAVLTAVTDPQFRTRAYGMGLDIYLEKPTTKQGLKLFLDCIESVLGQTAQAGFRGMQSKSLVDIIQLECLCRSSSVLKVSDGRQEGRIWFQNGEITEAAAPGLTGEAAFHSILAWKAGSFELLPAEPARPRTIFKSYEGLLLQGAQALDEAEAQLAGPTPGAASTAAATEATRAKKLARFPALEFGLVIDHDSKGSIESWAVGEPATLAELTRQTLDRFRALGEDLQVGNVSHVIGHGVQQHLTLAARPHHSVCLGFQRSVAAAELRAVTDEVLASLGV